MRTGSSYKKILFIIGGAVLLVFVGYYVLLADIKNKNENTSRIENGLSSNQNAQELLGSMQADLRNSDSDLTSFNNSIVASDGDVDFIESLESLAKKNGLDVSIDSLLFQDDPSISTSSMTFFNIKAKTEGSWAGTYTFLSELEQLPFKVKIKSFSFVNANAGPTTPDQKPVSGSKWDSVLEINVLKFK